MGPSHQGMPNTWNHHKKAYATKADGKTLGTIWVQKGQLIRKQEGKGRLAFTEYLSQSRQV